MVPSSPESFRNWRQWKSGCDLIFCNHIFHYKAWQENFIYSFLVFWKKLLQRFINLKIIIAKCDKKLLQSVTDLKKWGRIYYKVLLVLQGMTIITKWHVTRANYYRLIVHHFFCEFSFLQSSGKISAFRQFWNMMKSALILDRLLSFSILIDIPPYP